MPFCPDTDRMQPSTLARWRNCVRSAWIGKTLPALEIVRHALSASGAPRIEFITFLDGDESTGTCVERDRSALESSLTRAALTWL